MDRSLLDEVARGHPELIARFCCSSSAEESESGAGGSSSSAAAPSRRASALTAPPGSGISTPEFIRFTVEENSFSSDSIDTRVVSRFLSADGFGCGALAPVKLRQHREGGAWRVYNFYALLHQQTQGGD